jgi:beta-lactamase regulating signal transducer with metallopeptidase domain/protocatechuate 3,4-dioxygenase beta subunit
MAPAAIAWGWIVHSASAGLIILGLGSAAVCRCAQPVIRIRIIVGTLVAAAAVPWVAMLGIVPPWSSVVPRVPIAGPVQAVPAPRLLEPARPRLADSLLPGRARPGAAQPVMAAAPAVEQTAGGAGLDWRAAMVWAHVTGSLGLAAWWLAGQVFLFRLTRSARLAPAAVRDRLLAMSGPAGERVVLLASDRIGAPLTYTWARPVILLPAAVCEEPDSEALRYSLAHEWLHVEQGDGWRWNLACLAGAILFYQPLYWRLRRQLRLMQDYLADDRAAGGESRPDYAGFLVRVAWRVKARGEPYALGLGGRASSLHRRVATLLQERAPFQRRCRRAWSALVAAAAVLVVVTAVGFRPAAQDEPNTTQQPTDELTETAPAKVPLVKGPLHFSGRVKDQTTGEPLPGASVTIKAGVYVERAAEFKTLQETRRVTGVKGTFEFTVGEDLAKNPSLSLIVEARHEGYMAWESNSGLSYLLRNQGRGQRPFFEEIPLLPARSIEGRVLDPAGRPATGVVVTACSAPQAAEGSPPDLPMFTQARTDGQGRFKIDICTTGKAVFWLLPDDFALSAHVVGEGQRGDLGSFTLEQGARLRGRVLDAEGRPVVGVHVSAECTEASRGERANFPFGAGELRRRSVPTAADGSFAFGPLAPEEYVVKLEENWHDPPSRRAAGPASRKPLPGVFAPQKVRIAEGVETPPVEIRAVPHVVVEARYHDRKGNTSGGRRQTLWGFVHDELWHVEVDPDDRGRYVFLAPKGMERASMPIVPPSQANALQYRTTPGGPLMHAREIWLGTLDQDVKDIEIICEQAPTLFVKATGKGGRPVPGLSVSVDYTHPDFGPHGSPKAILKGGVQSDVVLEEQSDGRFRTMCLVPEREIVVIVRADGFKPEARQMTLPAGQTYELAVALEPE